MATTYTAEEAYTDAVAFSQNITIPSASQLRLVDWVNGEIWTAFPWEWTLASLTAISLVDGQQDYSISGSDTDFRVLTKAWLTRTDTTPDQYFGPLSIRSWLAPELDLELTTRHEAIAYVRTSSGLRLRLDRSVNLPTSVTVQIDGEYQKNPTKLSDLSTDTFAFPDEFYSVIVNGLIYYIYRWSGDRRAGDMRIDRNGNRQYTGALAAYRDALSMMVSSYDIADQVMVPSVALGAKTTWSPGLFQ